MSICVSWSTEHGCTRCRNRRECGDQGLSPFGSATALEINALVDAEVLPESYRREVHAIARAVDFAVAADGKHRITLELKRDDGVWFDIEEGDKVKVVMAEKKKAMETYEIWKNGRMFAAFEHGDPSRFGTIFDRETASKEFDSCVAHWTRHGVKAEWELRIRKHNAEAQVSSGSVASGTSPEAPC